MLKHVTPLLLIAACAPFTQAQVSLNATDNLPAIGDAFLMQTSTGYSAPLPGGTGVNFDYSAAVAVGSRTVTVIDPADYSNDAIFPTAEWATASPSDTLFFQETANGLERVGERQLIIAFDVEVPLSDPSLDLKLPLVHGQSWSDNIAATYTVDGNDGSRTGNITGTADAWGYLTLPGGDGPYEVLRVYTLKQETNNIQTDLFPVTVNRTHREYCYYAAFNKAPLLRWYSDTLVASIGGTFGSAGMEWLDASEVGLSETAAKAGFGLYPNPAVETVTIALPEGTADGQAVQVLDATGRVVLTQPLAGMLAGTRRDLQVAELLPGSYTLRLQLADGRALAQPFVKR